MKKDFATIKEMAKTKLLNGEEKKVLSKLYEEKIEARKAEVKAVQCEEYEKAKKQGLKKISQRPEVKKAMASIDSAERTIAYAEELLQNRGVVYQKNYSNNGKTLKLSTHTRYDGEIGGREIAEEMELKELYDKHFQRLKNIEQLKTDIKLALYLPSMTRAEIDEILEAELSKF